MRTQGIADLGEVRYAILEQNGKVSFLKESDSPNISRTIVIDTKPDFENIKEAGLSEEWLRRNLEKMNVRLDEIFLMTVNEDGEIKLIKKEKK